MPISLIINPHDISEIPCHICGSMEIYVVSSGNVHTMEYKEETYCKDCCTLLERKVEIVNLGEYI